MRKPKGFGRATLYSLRTVSRRTLVYVGIALAILVVGRLLSSPSPNTPAAPTASSAQPSATPAPGEAESALLAAVASASHATPLRRPASSVAELGVLTDESEADLAAVLDRNQAAELVHPKHCGDPQACDAVKATLRDEQSTMLRVVPSDTWFLDRVDLDAGARGLSAAQRAAAKKMPRVVVVHVSTATGPRQLAIRTAFAAAAAIAESVGGLVWDQLLTRIESAHDFAAHAVTASLDESAFRRDRVEVQYQPRQDGVVRLLTAGLGRFGAPDVEAMAVPTATSERMAEVLLAVAKAIADGATSGPVTLTRDDLGRARGQEYPTDAGLPAPAPVAIDVVSVHPENGDPNDFIARIEPPAGDGPIGTMDLAERFFGRLLAAAPEDGVMVGRREKAQKELAGALERWSAAHGKGRLLVQVPFVIPGDAGSESMWIEVTRFDARSVTGKLVDDPLGATDVARGDEVTRPRAAVEDLDARGLGP